MIRPATDAAGRADAVMGERSSPLVTRVLSRQARLSNWLATGLMVLLGVGILVWYYGKQFSRQTHLRQSRQLAVNADAGAEMALPPLGKSEVLQSPQPNRGQVHAAPVPTAIDVPRLVQAAGKEGMAAPTPLETALPVMSSALPASSGEAAARGSARAPGAPERRLQGDVYAGASGAAQEAEAETVSLPIPAPGTAAPAPAPGLLAAPDSVPAAARRLHDRTLLLSKGTFIDCTLETAINSSLPGITSCVTAGDTFSANGRVVLLERGTRLFGETQGQVQQGSARVSVLWTEARTPSGVVVPLESPGTDELGRAGLPGSVQRHFWERFGAAILLSTVDGAVQAAVQSSSRNSGTVIYNPGATQDVTTEALKGTVAIAPTVTKRNGDRIEVLVARDVDFADVYALRVAQSNE